MNDFKFYFFWVNLLVSIIASIILFPINWIFGLIFLITFVVQSIFAVLTYFDSIWWPYHKVIDTDCVDIEKVEIPSSTEGKSLNGVIIRKKNSDRTKKHVGILFHHGYTGFKEKVFRFAITLAMNDFVVLCPDGRGHGFKQKSFGDMEDFKGIALDVGKEIDLLASLQDVDKERLVMMGHSMGGIMTLSAGYKDDRIKKLVSISAPYDMLEMFGRHKTIITRVIRSRVTKYVKNDPEFIASGETIEEFSRRISAKYTLQYNSPHPDKDRVYLVHCKPDDLVLFDQALKAKEALDLPDKNCLFLEQPTTKWIMAAHNLTGQASIIATFCILVAKALKQ